MAELILKSRKFREEREEDWRRLERLLNRMEKGGPGQLSDDDLIAIPVLYRAALSSLSVARATSLDRALLEYLEGLCGRAYFVVYGVRSTPLERIRRFFSRDWPEAVQDLGRETLASFGIMLLGIFAAYTLVSLDSDWFYSFVGQGMTQGRDPTASTELLRNSLFKPEEHTNILSLFATILFTHNAQVAIFCYALGFMLAIPTAFMQLVNGCMVGAFLALYAQRGLGIAMGGWLFIHGTTELFAITIAAAAGFHIGWTVAFPGRRRRVDALIEAGRRSGAAMIGVVIMLFVAGALEGIGRQMVISTAARYAIGSAALALWLTYFYLPRRKEAKA